MWLALLIMCLGLVNLRFDQLAKPSFWIRGQIVRLAIGVPLCFLWVYLTLPAMVHWVGYTVMFLPLGINALLTALTHSAQAEKGKRMATFAGLPVVVLLVVLAVSFYLNILVIPVRATALRDVPVVQSASQPISVMNTDHIRLVPIETARWQAQKVVGNLGTGFEVGQLSVQMVNGKLYWVAPLEFRGLFKWLSFKEAPGFVMVDGEDPDEPAVLKTAKMAYTPSAYLQADLNRHIYTRFDNQLLLEPSFEVDDQMQPWYVMSVGVPTVGKTGVKVTGAILVNPATGQMTSFDAKDVPSWVDQVVPEYVAEAHNSWFGRYVHGFWNSVLGQKDVHIPTGWGKEKVDVFGVVGADDRFYWFTGHTSPSGKDDSLMGYTLMDGRSGVITYYENAAGYYNEAAAVSSVNGAVSNFAGWHGAQPLLYNIYGAESYMVPVLSDNNKLQAVGIVNAKTGQTIVKPTKAEALLAYRQYLGTGIIDAKPTQSAASKSISGKVTRFGAATMAGNTLFYISIEGSERIFTSTAAISPEVAVTKVGDRVSITYLDTTEPTAAVSSFDNLELGSVPH